MPKTLEDLNEWAIALRKEGHPLAETMEEIAEGWREDIDYLKKGTGMSDYNELVVEIQKLLPEGKGFGLTEMVLRYLYSELGYIPARVSASLSIKYKPEELKE